MQDMIFKALKRLNKKVVTWYGEDLTIYFSDVLIVWIECFNPDIQEKSRFIFILCKTSSYNLERLLLCCW